MRWKSGSWLQPRWLPLSPSDVSALRAPARRTTITIRPRRHWGTSSFRSPARPRHRRSSTRRPRCFIPSTGKRSTTPLRTCWPRIRPAPWPTGSRRSRASTTRSGHRPRPSRSSRGGWPWRRRSSSAARPNASATTSPPWRWCSRTTGRCHSRPGRLRTRRRSSSCTCATRRIPRQRSSTRNGCRSPRTGTTRPMRNSCGARRSWKNCFPRSRTIQASRTSSSTRTTSPRLPIVDSMLPGVMPRSRRIAACTAHAVAYLLQDWPMAGLDRHEPAVACCCGFGSRCLPRHGLHGVRIPSART